MNLKLWAFKTIQVLCEDFKCYSYSGHAYSAFVVVLENIMKPYDICSLDPEITCSKTSSTQCRISDSEYGNAFVFLPLAVILVVFTCTPDSPGYDMEVYDEDLVYAVLRHSVYRHLLSPTQLFYCRDYICKAYDYNFSSIRAPIFSGASQPKHNGLLQLKVAERAR